MQTHSPQLEARLTPSDDDTQAEVYDKRTAVMVCAVYRASEVSPAQIVEAVNAHASLTARVAELEAEAVEHIGRSNAAILAREARIGELAAENTRLLDAYLAACASDGDHKARIAELEGALRELVSGVGAIPLKNEYTDPLLYWDALVAARALLAGGGK